MGDDFNQLLVLLLIIILVIIAATLIISQFSLYLRKKRLGITEKVEGDMDFRKAMTKSREKISEGLEQAKKTASDVSAFAVSTGLVPLAIELIKLKIPPNDKVDIGQTAQSGSALDATCSGMRPKFTPVVGRELGFALCVPGKQIILFNTESANLQTKHLVEAGYKLTSLDNNPPPGFSTKNDASAKVAWQVLVVGTVLLSVQSGLSVSPDDIQITITMLKENPTDGIIKLMGILTGVDIDPNTAKSDPAGVIISALTQMAIKKGMQQGTKSLGEIEF